MNSNASQPGAGPGADAGAGEATGEPELVVIEPAATAVVRGVVPTAGLRDFFDCPRWPRGLLPPPAARAVGQ